MERKFKVLSLLLPVFGCFLSSCHSPVFLDNNVKKVQGEEVTQDYVFSSIYNDKYSRYDFSIKKSLNYVSNPSIGTKNVTLKYNYILIRGYYKDYPYYIKDDYGEYKYFDFYNSVVFQDLIFNFSVTDTFINMYEFNLMSDDYLTSKPKYSNTLIDFDVSSIDDYTFLDDNLVLSNFVDIFTDKLKLNFSFDISSSHLYYEYTLTDYYTNGDRISTRNREWHGNIILNNLSSAFNDTYTINNTNLPDFLNSAVDYNKYVYSYGHSGFDLGLQYGKVYGWNLAVEEYKSYNDNFNGFSLFSNVFTSIGSLLSIEIFPNFTLGVLISIPLIGLIVFTIIKLLG